MKSDPSYYHGFQQRFRNFQLWYEHACRGDSQRSLRQLTEMEMDDLMKLAKPDLHKKHRGQLHANKRFYAKARRIITAWQREWEYGGKPIWRGDEHLFTKDDPE